MAAGSFLLGLSQGMQSAQARSFERERFAAQQAERQARAAQIEQNNQLRRQEMQMMARQREQASFLQGLQAYSGIKDPTIKSQVYNKLLLPHINRDLQEGQANYAGNPVFLPSGTTSTDFETPNNPIDKAIKDINSIYKNKNFDRADRLAQVIPIINRIGSDPTYFPRIQKDLRERQAYLAESKNWFLINQVGMMNKDPNVTREWAARTAQIKKMGPDGTAVLQDVSENMAKANETMRKEKVAANRLAETRRLTQERENRVAQRAAARTERLARAAESRGVATTKAAMIKEVGKIRTDYRKEYNAYRKNTEKPVQLMHKNSKQLINLLDKHGDSIVGARGAVTRGLATAAAQLNLNTGGFGAAYLKNATPAAKAAALMVAIAFQRTKMLDPGKSTDRDFVRGQAAAMSNVQSAEVLKSVLVDQVNNSIDQANNDYRTLFESEAVELGGYEAKPRRRPSNLPERFEIRSAPQTATPPAEILPAVATQAMPEQPAPVSTEPVVAQPVRQAPQTEAELGIGVVSPPVAAPTVPPAQPAQPAPEAEPQEVQIQRKYQIPQPVSTYIELGNTPEGRAELAKLPRELLRRIRDAFNEMKQAGLVQ